MQAQRGQVKRKALIHLQCRSMSAKTGQRVGGEELTCIINAQFKA
jgi:hypothetical protein